MKIIEYPAMQLKERPMGDRWFWSLQMETLGRNMATAGGLTLAFMNGRSAEGANVVKTGRMPLRLARGTTPPLILRPIVELDVTDLIPEGDLL